MRGHCDEEVCSNKMLCIGQIYILLPAAEHHPVPASSKALDINVTRGYHHTTPMGKCHHQTTVELPNRLRYQDRQSAKTSEAPLLR